MIKFGPGGTAGLGYSEGLARIKEIGLSALEVEFTYGVYMKNEEARLIGQLAKKMGVSLSIHAPYYINLASEEKAKISASKKRILDSCERAHNMGAEYVVFHAGFYQKKSKEETFERIKTQILEINNTLKERTWKVMLAPELTGKPSQFGDIDELIRLKNETGCHLTVDFSHSKARSQGKMEYSEILEKLSGIKHIHSHFSGIEWTEKGERRHLLTDKEEIIPLAEEIISKKVDVTIINESPDPIGDAYKMKRIFDELS